MNNRTILLTNIQRFSLHDGPGIRTTIFLKGCSLQCPWCSNPENIKPYPQSYIKDGMKGVYGKYYNADELIAECLKDKNYYVGKLSSPFDWPISLSEQIEMLPGGITFSGGEPLLQIGKLLPVIKFLHGSGVHIAVETCLFVSTSSLKIALEFIDFFFVDIKILNGKLCNSVEHGNLELYLDNFDILMNWKDKDGKRKPVVIRIPVIGTYTDSNENRKSVYEMLRKYRGNILKIELIKEHNLGENKYNSLNMTPDYHGIDDGIMENYKEELIDLGIPIEICRI